MVRPRSTPVGAHRNLIVNGRLLLLRSAFTGVSGGQGEAQQGTASSDTVLSDAIRVLRTKNRLQSNVQ
jgi:hypothetical protein